MKTRIRVVEKSDESIYYPECKVLFFWRAFEHTGFLSEGEIVYFYSLEEAKDFVESEKRYHYNEKNKKEHYIY